MTSHLTLEDFLARERGLGVQLPPVPDDMERTWTVTVDGRLIPDARHVRLELAHPGKGLYRRVEYGAIGSEGNQYDAILYREAGGGGNVVIPWFLYDEILYIGIVIQDRIALNGKSGCAGGGYGTPGASRADDAATELAEETLVEGRVFGPIMRIPGVSQCRDRAWIDCSEPGDGVAFFAVRIVDLDALELRGGIDTFRFKEEVLRAAPDPSINVERVLETVFVPVEHVVFGCQDILATVGAARLDMFLRLHPNLRTRLDSHRI